MAETLVLVIVLRKIEPMDVPNLYRWENDATAWADGANHNPLSQKDLRDYVMASTGDIYQDGQLRLMVEVHATQADDGVTIGCIDLFDLDIRNRRAAIGMYIAPEYRGKGYGMQAVEQLEQYAFGFLHLRTLYAIIAESNIACKTIYEKKAFIPSSVLQGWTLEDDARIYIKHNENRI